MNGVSLYNQDVNTSVKYVRVVFAAFLMLMGENIEPQTQGEQLYTIFVMLIGACLYATIFGQMAVVINDLNRASSRYQEKLSNIREHMRNLELPLPIQVRVREYFDELWSLNRCLDRDTFYHDLSNPLCIEIKMHLYGSLVRKVPLFIGIDPTCILRIVNSLVVELFLKGDYLIREGEIGNEMYFLKRGRVVVFKREDPGNIFAVLTDHSYFGDVGLRRGIYRTAMIQAQTFCDTSKLTREAFEQVIEEFPDSGREILIKMNKKMTKYKGAKEAIEKINKNKSGLDFRAAAVKVIERNRSMKGTPAIRLPSELRLSSDAARLLSELIVALQKTDSSGYSPVENEE